MSATQKLQQHPVFVQAQNKAQHYVAQLDKELSKYPVLVRLEQRTQIPKSYAVLGTLVVVGILHTFNPLAAPVSNLVGWAVPAYLSFKALETPSDNDNIQWLTYWVVFGFFNFLESFAIRLVLYYLPWYYVFKTVFIIWLQMPGTRGAQATYFTILKPVLSNINNQNRAVAPTTTSADAHQE
ncbi:hypothetical protein AGABI1DRAFT_110028 [Agaricus bisporus var. burnettii JB137-S8]|uniref:Protein YOP1 n=2 Tax=Agaricus bisporus var. burnettii TaxID=192524 RepID=K5Y5H6_AGABU|nr:hypothetical protein AGABI2DRAFT_215430 [Agaricus bisporus var. bisporus H97]XP_007325344.1 uncharacterized protein AGABI1DRAFT_110028 [Agaricus bisporus var. burnettii JB137-S8]EKM83360.1 hypothetical protein AGABI1DRAFT_110028 [Agaricus bisporus var. burnettii JB137-S8]EKV51870.1 hypothetical protein AGABI2DRAFT_215430 [Agaricus bisporus var. bisporus H97]KAF7784811.1 hypothetical protein Agabi119p4_976 [Agaricus bisporus var. burnettii]